MRFIKENPALAAGIGLPFLLVVIFSLAAVIPQWLVAPPQYDLLFIANQYNNNSDTEIRLQVVGGVLKAEQRKLERVNNYYNNNVPHLYRYSVRNNSVQEINLSPKSTVESKDWQEFSVPEVQSLKLDNNSKAPDGYEFAGQYGYSGGSIFFPFGGRYRDGVSIIKDGRAVALPKIDGSYYYPGNVKFLGWIVSEGDKK